MTKRELVEKIKAGMPEFTGTEDEKEIKRALYIYIELGKMKSFDERYYFGSSKMKKISAREAIKDTMNPDRLAEKRKILCITMSHLYKCILSEFGINSEIITEMLERDAVNHMENVIKLKSGRTIIADVQLDMHRVQAGLSLHHFGVPCKYTTDTINTDELTKMLIEIGYIRDKNDYRDERIEEVRRQIAGLTPNEALRVIFNSPEICDGTQEMETVEAYKYYYSILKSLMPNEHGKKIFQFKCSKKRKQEEEPDYSFGIYATPDKNESLEVYIYSHIHRRMLSCDLETLAKMEDEGFKIGGNTTVKSDRLLKAMLKEFRRRRERQGGNEPR